MKRSDWDEFEKVQDKPDVRLSMRARCEEQGHEWENCCSFMFRVYQACKWCGAEK